MSKFIPPVSEERIMAQAIGLTIAYYDRFRKGDRLNDVDYRNLSTAVALRKWYEGFLRQNPKQRIPTFEETFLKLKALNQHFLPRMFADLQSEDFRNPTTVIERFVQVASENHLLVCGKPTRHLLKLLGGIDENDFLAVVMPQAEIFSNSILFHTKRAVLSRNVLRQEFIACSDPFQYLLRKLDDLTFAVTANCMEAAGWDFDDEEGLNQRVIEMPLIAPVIS